MKANLHLRIEPLSYIHIGNGSIADPFNMLIKNNRAIFVNTNAYIKYLSANHSTQFKTLLNNNQLQPLMKFMYEKFDTSNPSLIYSSFPVDKNIEDQYVKDLQSGRNQCQIYQFYRNSFKQAILPGSSLKGSIRTAILNAIYNKKDAFPTKDLEYNLLNCISDNRKDITKDPFRFIKIGDAKLTDDLLTIKPMTPVNVKSPASSIQNLDLLYEVLKPFQGEKIKTDIIIDYSFFKNNSIELAKPFPVTTNLEGLKAICSIINEFYKSKLKADLDSLKGTKYASIHAGIMESFNSLADHQFILKLGKGSGRHYISFSKTRLLMPKTRNLIENKSVGWCRITFTN